MHTQKERMIFCWAIKLRVYFIQATSKYTHNDFRLIKLPCSKTVRSRNFIRLLFEHSKQFSKCPISVFGSRTFIRVLHQFYFDTELYSDESKFQTHIEFHINSQNKWDKRRKEEKRRDPSEWTNGIGAGDRKRITQSHVCVCVPLNCQIEVWSFLAFRPLFFRSFRVRSFVFVINMFSNIRLFRFSILLLLPFDLPAYFFQHLCACVRNLKSGPIIFHEHH